MQTMVEHQEEIRLLQKVIRSVLVRAEAKEEVLRCEKEKVNEPHMQDILSPMEGEKEEEMFLTQTTISRCLEAEFGVESTITKYFVQKDEKELAKKWSGNGVPKIDRDSLYGYYMCNGKEAYSVV